MEDVHYSEVERAYARAVRARRLALGRTQKQVADDMAVRGFASWRQTVVAKVEANERPLRLGEAVALAEVLQSDMESLLGRDPASDDARARVTAAWVRWERAKRDAEQAQAELAAAASSAMAMKRRLEVEYPSLAARLRWPANGPSHTVFVGDPDLLVTSGTTARLSGPTHGHEAPPEAEVAAPSPPDFVETPR